MSAGLPAVIPSPTQGVWYLGPFPIRAYALLILIGILIAIRMGERRWIDRGGHAGAVLDLAAWGVPFGILGGRIYHVITTWQPYFGKHGDPIEALYIWHGGLGIWGAVALGSVGTWIGARRAGIRLPALGDAVAPGIALAQAVGRLGNWVNNELHGTRTDLPWGVRIYDWDIRAGHAIERDGHPVVLGTFHPTFLYEALWDVGVAGVVIWADRRFRLGHGRAFALYVLLYTAGRGWVETLRDDPANRILGQRLNFWTSLIVGLGALAYLVISARLRPGRETSVLREAATSAGVVSAADTEPDDMGTHRDNSAANNVPEQGMTAAVATPSDKGVPGPRISDSEGSNNDSR